MIRLRDAFRIIHISWVLLRHGLDEVVLAAHLFRAIRFFRFFSPFYWFSIGKRPAYGVRIRRSLEDLGPIFVKFGQMVSTRRDLLPDHIADELVKLQDKVPPFSGDIAVRQIEKALKAPIDDIFKTFDRTPLASASIAQVHAATLPDGTDVVVKVLRPNIDKIIQRDVSLLETIAKLAQRYSREARRLRPVEVANEFRKTIFDELDLMREAANASQLKRNFENSSLLYVPDVYWDYCRRNIMVLERIYGTNVGQVGELINQNISMKMLGERGVEIFFTQVFRDNFFHADMHPGNIFVSPEGQYIAIDFGIMGTLTTEDQRYLAENLLAFFNRDYRRVAELHVESEWVPKTTRIDEFEAAIRTVSEPIFEKPLAEISFGHFLLRLFQVARRFDMEVQPQLVLLQKTLLNIEGLGRQLYPELDLWSTAKPFIEDWIKQQVGPRAFARRMKENLPLLSEQLPEIPLLAYRVLKDASEGRLKVNYHSEQLQEIHRVLKKQHQQTLSVITGSSLLITGGVIYGLGASSATLLMASGTGGLGLLLVLGGILGSRLK
ncbi:MAG: ubiquinone biosynthesis regulatory protein kinase UbiB [Gammaproteobacteria bacterium]